MKRFWIGLGILFLLLGAGFGITHYVEQAHRPISDALAQASHAALAGNWAQAARHSTQAKQQWESCRDLAAAFADHSVLELAESLFAEVDIYAETGDIPSFAATCAHLSRLVNAIAESHLPKWQNLL